MINPLNKQRIYFLYDLLNKIPVAMRITLLLLCVFAFQLHSEQTYSQQTKISLNMKNSSIEKILQTIEEKSEFYFLYNSKLINVDRKTNIRANEESIASILKRLFGSENVEYEVKGTQIILHPKEMNRIVSELVMSHQQQQRKQITGRIIDIHGEPIIGANIIEKGTTNGTVTDINGNFTLATEEDAVLLISYIGYLDQEIKTAGSTSIELTLHEDTKTLEEVVVVGYGTARKQDLSMAISTVKIDESMKSRPSDFNTLMQGRLPGVTIQSAGGDPLKSGTVSIRGRGSRGLDGDPGSGDGILFVVDGVPNAPFSMADVETVTVLKDAASAAIYGATVGSGGVIVITTKQSQSGKAKVNFNMYQGIQQVGKVPGTLTSEQYNEVWARAIADKSPVSTSVLPAVADPIRYPYGAVTRTDWMDEIFRTAYQQHYDLDITGGTDMMKALASFSYDKNEGTLLNTYRESLNAKLNLDFQLTNWMKVSQKGTFRYTNGQGNINTTSHEGVIINAIFYPRSATIYEYDKTGNQLYNTYGQALYGGTIPQYLAEAGISGYGEIRNPVATLHRLRQNRPSSTIYSTTGVEIKPISGLTVKSDFTASLRSDRYEYFSPKIPEIGRPNPENERYVSSSWNTNWLWETTATYSAEIAERHNISALLGYTMARENYRFTSTAVYDFNKEDEHSTIFPGGSNWEKTRPGETIWDESSISAFGRIGYSFDDRYFATMSLRRDATSKLFRDNNSGVFPAFSASWKISSEPFFQSVKENMGINLLKVRASWGQIGNIKLVPRYSYNAPLAFPNWPYILGENTNNEVYGVYQQTVSNPNLRWETTEQTGAGLDLTILNNSLDISVDYFHKTTKDLIEQLPPPSVAGIEVPPYENVGKVLNKGWEFSASYNKTVGKVNFNLWGNLSTVKNEVQDLGRRSIMAHSNTLNALQPLQSAVGQPWYSYYLIKTDGIFQSQAEIDAHVNAQGVKIQPNAVPGDIRFVDKNGDGIINDEDRDYMGSYLPKFTYSFGGRMNYRGFDFSVMLQGVDGVNVYNGFKQMGLTGRNAGNNMLSQVLDSWNYNKTSGLPRLSIAGDANNNYGTISDFFLENGRYLRLKNITLGYTLPKSTMSAIGLHNSNMRFYVSGENIATFTPYGGLDPEVGNFGLDGGNYPVPRSVSLGINVNF